MFLPICVPASVMVEECLAMGGGVSLSLSLSLVVCLVVSENNVCVQVLLRPFLVKSDGSPSSHVHTPLSTPKASSLLGATPLPPEVLDLHRGSVLSSRSLSKVCH